MSKKLIPKYRIGNIFKLATSSSYRNAVNNANLERDSYVRENLSKYMTDNKLTNASDAVKSLRSDWENKNWKGQDQSRFYPSKDIQMPTINSSLTDPNNSFNSLVSNLQQKNGITSQQVLDAMPRNLTIRTNPVKLVPRTTNVSSRRAQAKTSTTTPKSQQIEYARQYENARLAKERSTQENMGKYNHGNLKAENTVTSAQNTPSEVVASSTPSSVVQSSNHRVTTLLHDAINALNVNRQNETKKNNTNWDGNLLESETSSQELAQPSTSSKTTRRANNSSNKSNTTVSSNVDLLEIPTLTVPPTYLDLLTTPVNTPRVNVSKNNTSTKLQVPSNTTKLDNLGTQGFTLNGNNYIIRNTHNGQRIYERTNYGQENDVTHLFY